MAGGRPRPNPGFQRVPLDERLDAGRAPEPDHRLVDPEERPLPRQLGRERLQAQTHHDFLEFFIEADALHRAGHDPAIDEVRLPRFEAGCGGELDLDLRPLRFPVRPEKPPGGERRENRKDPRPRDAQAGSRHDFAVVIFIVVRFAHGERKSARESLEYPCKRFTALNPASRWTLIRCWKFQLTRKSTRLTAYTERMSWFFWKEASPIPCGMEDADDGNRLFKWHVKEEVASESRKHKPPDLFVPPGGMTHQGAKFGIRCEQIRCVQDCLAHPPGGLGIVRGNVIKNLSISRIARGLIRASVMEFCGGCRWSAICPSLPTPRPARIPVRESSPHQVREMQEHFPRAAPPASHGRCKAAPMQPAQLDRGS